MASAELKLVLEMLAAGQQSRPENPTVEQMRAGMETALGALPVDPAAQFTPVDAGGVPAEWLDMPGGDTSRAVLYFHGGGYVIGSPKTHRSMNAKLASAAGARLLSVDYRLAPEHPCPAAIEDAVASYRWLLDQGFAPQQIAISGDSAGGGLTVATLVALREQGLPQPAAAAPISPWVDLTGDSETMETRGAVDPMVQRDGLRGMAAMYLGGADPANPQASPLFADLAGLPPLLIQVGDHETLLGDSQKLEARAKAAGVEATLEVWDEMIHVWHAFQAILPEGAEALERIGGFFKERWSAAQAAAAE